MTYHVQSSTTQQSPQTLRHLHVLRNYVQTVLDTGRSNGGKEQNQACVPVQNP